jgi:CheY-like chemotaxis protein
VKERHFEPFFTTKEPGKGTGLGLAIVQGVVRESGGHIQVDSEPGRGTRFEVFWPEAPADALAARPAQPGPAGQVRLEGTPVVLVIEDEASVRAGARRILEQAGCQVLEAGNGQEALALVARTERLDLVLSDVVMPRLGGKSFAARLAQLRPRVPVLFMSGYTADPDLLDGLPNAYPHLVPKPFTPQVLQHLVLEALGRVPAGTEDPEGSGGVGSEGVKELGSTAAP